MCMCIVEVEVNMATALEVFKTSAHSILSVGKESCDGI